MEKLKDKVVQKINNEYNNFVKELKQCNPEEIIDRAYEHVCKQEMLYIYENMDLSYQECKALLRCPNVLDDCYDEWLKTDANFNELLRLAADNSLEHIVDDYKREVKEKNRESR